LMSRFHHRHASPLLLVSLAALTYFSAEFMHGYGIFSIAVYALVFEKSLLEKKAELRVFSRNFSDFFSVLAFMLLGFILPTGITFLFILKTLAFFIIYLLLRMGSVYLSLHDHEDFSFNELFFISFTPSKGLTVAALALFLSEFSFIPKELPELIILFLLISIMLSTMMAILAKSIFRKDIEE
jgi:NhaP-type Na+/H+ and K+/H+ antiporter